MTNTSHIQGVDILPVSGYIIIPYMEVYSTERAVNNNIHTLMSTPWTKREGSIVNRRQLIKALTPNSSPYL